jgi:hypothetical protein
LIKGGTWSLSDISGSHAFIIITYNSLGHNAQEKPRGFKVLEKK